MHAITQACADANTRKFMCAIYHMCEIIVFSISVLLLFHISCKENVPKHGIHFAWKDILLELLSWMFKTALYTLLTF